MYVWVRYEGLHELRLQIQKGMKECLLAYIWCGSVVMGRRTRILQDGKLLRSAIQKSIKMPALKVDFTKRDVSLDLYRLYGNKKILDA